jgi:surface antigen
MSNIVSAKDDETFDLLAGVEAGIDTATAMSEYDLTQTQYVLNYHPVGVGYSWYNRHTDTIFRIEVKKHYLASEQYCALYHLEITHDIYSSSKNLRACQNMSGKWIALIKEANAKLDEIHIRKRNN